AVGRGELELKPGDRGAARRAGLVGDYSAAVMVGEVRGGHRVGAGRVQVLADVEIGAVVAGLAPGALIAGPAEVLHEAVGGIQDAVDLLPVVPTDVAGPQLTAVRAEREAERVALPVGDDPLGVHVGIAREGVVRRGRAGGRVDPDDAPVQRDRVAAGAQVLAAQRAAFGGCGRPRPPPPTGRVAAGVERAAVLAPVGKVEARPVAAAGVELPVGPELHRTDRVGPGIRAPNAPPR